VNIASLEHVSPQLAEGGDLFVFAVRQLHESHIDQVQRIRAAFVGMLAVVATLPPQSLLLKVIRAGADDFIDADADLDLDVEELVSRCESSKLRSDGESHLITVIPCQSSSDGNLLSLNIAALLAQKRSMSLLLDFHMRGGDLALMLALSPQHTFLELVRQRRNIDRAMLEQALTVHRSGIRLLAGPEMFSDLQDIQLHVSQQILDIAKMIAPNVVVSIEDLQHAEQVHALTKSDTVVLVARTNLVSLARAKQHVKYLLQIHVPLERICVVALSPGVDGELPIGSFKKILRMSRVHLVSEDVHAVNMSINVGNPLVFESPKSKMSRGLVELVEQLRNANALLEDDAKATANSTKPASVLSLNPLRGSK
jgi:pilus assembly protein CpaE